MLRPFLLVFVFYLAKLIMDLHGYKAWMLEEFFFVFYGLSLLFKIQESFNI